MQRERNWNVRLAILVRSLIGKPFIWGETDCVSVLRKAYVAMYDEDPIAEFVPMDYSTEEEAKEAFRAIGGDFTKWIMRIVVQEVTPMFARDGDMVFNEDSAVGYQNVGIVLSDRILISDIKNGVHMLPLNRDVDDDKIHIYRLP